MKISMLTKDRPIWITFFLYSILIGGICFVAIYGVAPLNVMNDKWLLNAEDLNQHYIGWKFFRRSNWRFPFGLIEGITELPTSIVYTDSIPLFAIFFKIFSPLLPGTFQYFGIWGITCFVLQTYFAMLLLRPYVVDKNYVIFSSIFFTLSPVVLMRMYVHSALGGNWLILAALTAYSNRRSIKEYKSNIIVWGSLMLLAVSIHMYYIPMILAIMCTNYLNKFLDNKTSEVFKLAIITISIAVISALALMFALGVFYGEPNVLQGGVREFSTNLNAFFNPQGYSLLMRDQSLVSSGQWEGYAYLGSGIIAILLVGLGGKVFNKKKEKFNKNTIISILILFFVCGGYALSPCISWGGKVLIDIPWPHKIIAIFSIFRATGRLIWPVYYIIFSIALLLVMRQPAKKKVYIVLACGILLQIIDIFPLIKSAKERTNISPPPSIMETESWDELKGKFNKIEFITNYSGVGNPNSLIVNFFPSKTVFDISNYACNNNMDLNDFYIGRRNGKFIEETKYTHWQELLSGKINKKTIYIFNKLPYALTDESNISIYKYDGIYVGISSSYKWSGELKNKLSEIKPTNILADCYVTDGETTDESHIIYPNGISYGPYIPVDEGMYKITLEGTGLDKGIYDVFSGEQNKMFLITDLVFSASKVSFNVKLNEPVYDVEFRMTNSSDKNIEINKIKLLKVGGDY